LKKPINKKSKVEPTTEITGRDLKNLKVFELARTGKTQSEIGDEVGLTRKAINEILNSDQAKQFIERARSRLLELQDEAVLTLQDAMADRDKDMKTAVQAATTILKGTGVLKESVTLNDGKPFIVEFLDGTQVKMGIGSGKDQ
jgi:predicted transcriptional regulator